MNASHPRPHLLRRTDSRFPVHANDLLDLFQLGLLPDGPGDGVGSRHDEHAGLDLQHVAVPQFLLVGRQRLPQSGRDQVLDPDEARVGAVAVVDDALADIFSWFPFPPTGF